jgi:hypothetical protein
MTQALTTTQYTTANDDYAIIEKVAILGDLSPLSAPERVTYYTALCRSLGLNPLTKPFEYLQLDNKLVLYATRGATDQLREAKQVSVRIVSKEALLDLGVYRVEVEASTPDGRADFASGIVAIEKEGGEWQTSQGGKRYFAKNGQYEAMRGVDLANAMMKAETKAKRRATLSIAGLGWMDESEVGDVPQARRAPVNVSTGEVMATDVRPVLIEELRQLAIKAKGLGLDLGLKLPREMSNEELGQAIVTAKAMIESEYNTIEAVA